MKPLPQRDYDATMIVSGRRASLRITGIPPRAFERPAGSIDPGDPRSVAYLTSGDPRNPTIQSDTKEKTASIQRAIAKKLARRYAADADSEAWLLVFTASPLIEASYREDGKLIVGEPSRRAREYLKANPCRPFSEIWFMCLIEIPGPVRVWPPEDPVNPWPPASDGRAGLQGLGRASAASPRS